MATVVASGPARAAADRSAVWFAVAAVSLIAAACLLAGWAPLGFSIVTVFLFAGPHNWLEARYMLTRMPARWGPLTGYFVTGIAGVLLLTAAISLLPWTYDRLNLGPESWPALLSLWNTLLIGWVLALVLLRSRQNPRRNWSWTIPVAFVLVALAWLWPAGWGLGLVYLHPLIALWFLDREIGRMRREWQVAYRACLLLVPVALAALWWNLAGSPHLPGEDLFSRQLTGRIAQHAGEGIVSGVSSHFLIAAHTFLEMLHYGVWIVAIPLVSVRMMPWRLDNVPLARRSPLWRGAILAAIGLGVIVMLGLWGAFLADYPLTRDIYFTVAMLHVLAEAPFLLRLL
ncbi:MAG: hypothetical protein SFU86_02200 [Pirellulaceae bacterium]|nr:hypothetical protein [Pirellulaceae bacterium]